jgi:pantoate kinase
VCSPPPPQREPFLRSGSLGQGVVLDRQVFHFCKSFLFSIFRLKLYNRIQNQNYNKV